LKCSVARLEAPKVLPCAYCIHLIYWHVHTAEVYRNVEVKKMAQCEWRDSITSRRIATCTNITELRDLIKCLYMYINRRFGLVEEGQSWSETSGAGWWGYLYNGKSEIKVHINNSSEKVLKTLLLSVSQLTSCWFSAF
jgi:ABC-type transport system involved in multi-copper enzyme maturation permease subunit